MKRKLVFLYTCFLFFSSAIIAQERSLVISGTVVSADDGKPLPGVSVTLKGTSTGAVTGAAGEFNLKLPSSEGTLVFSFIGFQPKEVPVEGRNEINVALDSDLSALDEVVVVGFGTQSRRTITSAITKIGGEEIQDIPISTIGEGLKGKVAGARVYQSNNSPGADAVFRIRGGSSINKSNDPLVLVDGVERAFSGINPNDVESIEILKDAASTAIYGSRASNGVVLITTKQGKLGAAPRITFDMD